MFPVLTRLISLPASAQNSNTKLVLLDFFAKERKALYQEQCMKE